MRRATVCACGGLVAGLGAGCEGRNRVWGGKTARERGGGQEGSKVWGQDALIAVPCLSLQWPKTCWVTGGVQGCQGVARFQVGKVPGKVLLGKGRAGQGSAGKGREPTKTLCVNSNELPRAFFFLQGCMWQCYVDVRAKGF